MDGTMTAAEPWAGLHMIDDRATGLQGVIAIHSTTLGPSFGGCRLWSYDDRDDMIHDARRLSRGMTYKNALAGLPFGGGKAVLQRPRGNFDRAAVFRALGDAIAALDGRYVTAEDVGTTLADMKSARTRTRHVAGLDATPGMAGGDPSPWTALGVFEAMREAARSSLGTELADLTVAVQGVGNVGAALCRLLHEAGARLIVADVDADRVATLATQLSARIVATDEIASVQADVFAPCALGGGLTERSIPALKARLVCGGANNQLATDADGLALAARGVVYAPDYLVNAGGIINVAAEYLGESEQAVRERVARIPARLREVLRIAGETGQAPHEVADAMVDRIMARAPAAAV